MNEIELAKLNQSFSELNLDQSLRELVEEFEGDKIVFSSSLGLEDQVITDAIFRLGLPIEVFTLDTQRLFTETENLITETEKKYDKTIIRYLPEPHAVEVYINEVGLNGFYESIENRKRCCQIRKIEPLERALKGADIWITGIRQAQSNYRQRMQRFEIDESRNLLKFNPLLSWSSDALWKQVKEKQIPFNPLHLKNYPSIGCEPCTRAIKATEDERAGRWWWENQDTTKQECGLHITRKEI